MKTNILMLFIATIFAAEMTAQENKPVRIPSLGEMAPSFEANATTGKIKFPDDYYGKWKIIMSHPAGFTPVCTSELIELANIQEDFKKLNTQLVIISTDGVNSNLEWINSMESMAYNGKQTPKILFPIISDIGLDVSKKYGMQHPMISNTKNVRGVFIVDPENKIRMLEFYPLTIGRNTEEIKRVLIALQESDKENVMTPANWTSGKDFLLPAPANKDEFEKMKDKKKDNQYYLAWYMWFRKN